MPPEAERDQRLDWLIGLQRFGVRPGLERAAALLAELGEPQRRFDSVLVGGTNGKGSVVATLSSTLIAAGRRVGAFVSPHLMALPERFLIGGTPVAMDHLLAAIDVVRPAADALGATHFETLFALACLLFEKEGVELAVMEVGLGGRYDATNLLPARLSIVTNVDLDHTEVLGATVEAIAADKAAILRAGRPALTAAAGPALTVIEAHAAAVGAPLQVLGREVMVTELAIGWSGSRFALLLDGHRLEIATPLVGRHQVANVALALAAAARLGAPASALRAGAEGTGWPGRFELLAWRGRRLLLDGAHNPAAARALGVTLSELASAPLALVVGCSVDKDAVGMLAALKPLAAVVVASQARFSPRARPAAELAELIGADAWNPDPERALELAAAAAPDATLLVVGSLFLVAEVRALALGAWIADYPRYQ